MTGKSVRRLISSFSSVASGPGGGPPISAVLGVAQDRRDARVCVLHVVDRVLLRLLGGEVEIDLDRLVGAAVDEIPARRVDTDLVQHVVEEDDVAGALRRLRRLAAPRQVHELVEQHLDAVGVEPEHAGDAAYQRAVA